MNIKEAIKKEKSKQTPYLFGEKFPSFKPPILDRVFGDGECLIYIMSTDTRPYYYLVLVDSSFVKYTFKVHDREGHIKFIRALHYLYLK